MKIFLAIFLLINFSFSQSAPEKRIVDVQNGNKFIGVFSNDIKSDDNGNDSTSDNLTIFDEEFAPNAVDSDGRVDPIDRTIFVSVNTAKFYYFYGKTYEQRRRFDLAQVSEILRQEEFDNERPTVLYLHGYSENMGSESIQLIVNSYLTRNDHNIIVLDWSKLAKGTYMTAAVPNAMKLSDALSDSILDLINDGLHLDKFHVVGHSLGGQLAGAVGRKIKEKSNNSIKLRRISALDPAMPGFYPSVVYKALNKFDAKFVDVIHTNGLAAGAPISTGTVDFWPNTGKLIQPGCIGNVCSHQRSWRYWAESVASKDSKMFAAVKCASWDEFKKRRCDFDIVAYMGINCPTNTYGDFYLQTNKQNPFGKGMGGVKFY
ncbi:hypothetical protein PVAND_017083 [Polypedilum vanderplanki]|uniref:Lipase domain-containing protein n=1 Tax=Polypedilum vanderplanki TaxID=319348 RepID=A0A9J6BHA0_POLVA|nr:hypothetical protein PVAND_017083 [Polypedilum vanderplanki]